MAARKKTKWPVAELSRVGRGALALAVERRASIEPRLAAGLIDGLSADLDAFEGKRSASTLAQETLRSATRTQNGAARAGLEFLMAMRQAILRNGATGAQRAAFGLALRPSAAKVSSVVAGLEAFISAAARYPEVTRESGLLPADVEQAEALKAALLAADAEQESTKQTRKTPTAERDALGVRIERAVDAIVAAGQMAFVLQPAVAARFRALVPTSRKPAKARPTG